MDGIFDFSSQITTTKIILWTFTLLYFHYREKISIYAHTTRIDRAMVVSFL